MSVLDPEFISAEKSETPLLREIEEMLKSELPLLKANAVVSPIQLVGSSGKTVKLPIAALQALQKIIDYMVVGKVLQVTPYNQALDEQSAANFLNVGKEFLMKLLDTGELPCIEIGTQRFVLFSDLMVYKKRVSQERRQALAEMLQLSQETGTL
jgi:excisionase family DNA binding protein